MATLDRLFGETDIGSTSDDRRAADEAARIRAMVGGGRAADHEKADSDTQTDRLRAIVGRSSTAGSVTGSAAVDSAPAASPSAPRVRRSRGRRTVSEWVNGAVAIVAIAAVIAVVSAVVVQSTSSTEVAQAAGSLRTQEAELRNRMTTLQTSLALYGAAVDESLAIADAAEAALSDLEGKTDETARSAALQAVAVLREALAAREAPTAPPTYERTPSGPADDLATVAAQLDGVRAASEEVDAAIRHARTGRSQVDADQASFVAAMAAFGATLPATAATIVAENTAAGEEFRVAVTSTADAVGAAQQRGSVAVAEMAAYSAAVDGLRAENERVLAELATPPVRRNRGWVPPRTTVPPAQETPPADEGTAPPVEEPPAEDPVDPVVPPPAG